MWSLYSVVGASLLLYYYFSVYVTIQLCSYVIQEAYLFLKNKLELPINREKSSIRRPSNFELLGHGFVPTYRKGEKAKYQLVVKEGNWGNLKRKLKDIIRKTQQYSFDERLQKFAQVWKRWVNKFRLASIQAKLKTMDEWLRNCLRH